MKDLRVYEGNPHVEKVLRSNLQFTRDFKVKAVKAFESGKPASEIFAEAGIDLKDFGHGYGSKCIKRWQESIKKYGKKNLNKERRGVEASGRPGSLKFKSIEEEIEYLRAENDFLKKLRALEEGFVRKKNTK